ncbi:MAG: hypothetical protein ACO3NK_01030 [Prochlorotrichaceae cyanobacterium]|jgi:hypothetical protein
MSDKQVILELVNCLPEDVSFEAILKEVEFIIAVKKGLPQVDQDLTIVSIDDLRFKNQQFWQGFNVVQKLQEKQFLTFEEVCSLNPNFWPEEESIDDFLAFLNTERHGTES